MAQYNHLQIFQSVYKMNLEVYRTVAKFPREYKYGLGKTLKEIASSLINYVIEANSEEDKTLVLKRATLRLEQLRIHFRLARDLNVLGLKRYEYFNKMIEEISKQLYGWLDWAKCNKVSLNCSLKSK